MEWTLRVVTNWANARMLMAVAAAGALGLAFAEPPGITVAVGLALLASILVPMSGAMRPGARARRRYLRRHRPLAGPRAGANLG